MSVLSTNKIGFLTFLIPFTITLLLGGVIFIAVVTYLYFLSGPKLSDFKQLPTPFYSHQGEPIVPQAEWHANGNFGSLVGFVTSTNNSSALSIVIPYHNNLLQFQLSFYDHNKVGHLEVVSGNFSDVQTWNFVDTASVVTQLKPKDPIIAETEISLAEFEDLVSQTIKCKCIVNIPKVIRLVTYPVNSS